MNQELAPCPFCGSKEVKQTEVFVCGRDIFCTSCEVAVYWSNKKKGDAISLWNRRAKVFPIKVTIQTADHMTLSELKIGEEK